MTGNNVIVISLQNSFTTFNRYSSGPRSGRLAKWEFLQSGKGWSLHQKDPFSLVFFELARGFKLQTLFNRFSALNI
jgi:hypothetical protein